jgi:menaquinone-specific isochorismate synthase
MKRITSNSGDTGQNVPRLRVRTRFVDRISTLCGELPTPRGVSAWLRGTDGIVGWGEAVCCAPGGADRFARAQQWWQQVCARAKIEDEVGLPGSGLVAFVSFAFADDPGDSWVTVPETIFGRSGDRCWCTTVEALPGPTVTRPAPRAPRPPGPVRFADGDVSPSRYRAAVATAVRRIRDGQAEKIVLARDLLAEAEHDIDPRHLLTGLAAADPACWAFCVGGLVGATPELLLRKQGAVVESTVLAGTSFPGRYRTGDTRWTGLSDSAKDRAEHGYAVRSVLDGLAPVTVELSAAAEPALLRLATLEHLATDVRGRLRAGAPGFLSLVGALHPTAAVGGMPRDAALRQIAALEPMDRGRYAGPVGWINAEGDGEVGIALRCGQLDGRRLRLFAGCGVVAASDPDVEAIEAEAKFGVLRAALTRDGPGPDTAAPVTTPAGRRGPDERGTAMPFDDATDFPHLHADLERVRALIDAQISVTDQRIHEPCGHLIRRGGRLFRPTLVLTSAYPFAPEGPAGDDVIRAAAIVEMLHVATLYHDDLCDDATERRGVPTVNAVYGDAVALLCGDYLLAVCTELLSTMGKDAIALYAETLKGLCKGQFLETVEIGDAGRTVSAYFESIAGKTAKLMSSSAAFGALQAGATPEQCKTMASYGHHLGVAFQIWDDLLDLWSAVDTGKPRFSDLRNGVYTLPVIYGIAARPAELGALLGEQPLSDQACTEILALLETGGARDRCLADARSHLTAALSAIGELGELAGEFLPQLVSVAKELMPEVDQLLTAVLAQGSDA